MLDTKTKLVQIIYEGQSIDVSQEIAAALNEGEKAAEAQKRQKRRRNSNVQVSEDRIDNIAFQKPIGFEDDFMRKTDIQRLREAFSEAGLTEKQKKRLMAYYFDSLTYREIAAREGVNHKSVVESVHYAVKKIKIFFQGHPQKRL